MLAFSKLVGTGNDFVFIDARSGKMPADRQQAARAMCERHMGVGADGLIFVEERGGKLAWDFYNCDGSTAEFCGNAARCMGRWAEVFLGLKKVEFKSTIGDVTVEKHGEDFQVLFAKLSAAPVALPVPGILQAAYLVNSGVPHIVCKSGRELLRDEEAQVVKEFRFHKSAGAKGANVTFLVGNKTKSFERGVEGVTLSCGTGVLASASVLWKETGAKSFELETPGGFLRVEILEADAHQITKAHLIGPAQLICKGEFA